MCASAAFLIIIGSFSRVQSPCSLRPVAGLLLGCREAMEDNSLDIGGQLGGRYVFRFRPGSWLSHSLALRSSLWCRLRKAIFTAARPCAFSLLLVPAPNCLHQHQSDDNYFPEFYPSTTSQFCSSSPKRLIWNLDVHSSALHHFDVELALWRQFTQAISMGASTRLCFARLCLGPPHFSYDTAAVPQ